MNNLYIGNTKAKNSTGKATGKFIEMGREKFYEIEDFDSMLPFFISIASDSNHWMYISSTGGLTAGRINSDSALFPYYTDDKIHESAEVTGSKTILQVTKNEKVFLWEPLSNRYKGVYAIKRKIFKSVIGNKIVFEEQNIDLGLTFRYGWLNSDKFGWIKKSWLINNTNQPVEISLIDGFQNVLPYGVNEFTQNKFSTLVDAYKKSELIPEVCLALFRMESLMADRAEPSEALRTTTVWSVGLPTTMFLLSSAQLDNFRTGSPLTNESEAKGVRGAFFIVTPLTLEADETKTWHFAAEVNQDAVKVNNLIEFLKSTSNLQNLLDNDIEKGTKALQSIIAQADGIQDTADENLVARHFSNTLFNVMRGGIYSNDYTISKNDFTKHVKHFNASISNTYSNFLKSLPESISYAELNRQIKAKNDANFYRLFLEYLPLTFSRRHGDPSRPWNKFNINIKDENGNRILYYEGNWRDIFQNWEALSLSYPGFVHSIIAKFLNASTIDGYNPYRITKDGIDWEVIEPDNPWSNIGYWGDHQIVYLLRLMEVSNKYFPGYLNSWLNSEIFAFANVPYRIKGYREIVANPKNTVTFDNELNKRIENEVKMLGADAKLILGKNNNVALATLTEKLLVTLLAKLSNFIPEAGIWMNTLRPEWNDANNALVGYGTSMVTLYYLHRFLLFVKQLYQAANENTFAVSMEVATFFINVNNAFTKFQPILPNGFNNSTRKELTDKLGEAGENYRNSVYGKPSNKKVALQKDGILKFIDLTLSYITQSVKVNKRADKLYNAYNLISFSENSISIRNLYEMLEGQVAVLSSGILSSEEAVELLNALRNSKLYRPDQQSYILYPNKQLPTFLEKNNIPENIVKSNKILRTFVETGDTAIIAKDKEGKYHFNSDFLNAEHLTSALENYQSLSKDEVQGILDIYEKVFDHQSFTGRSGTFYKYEGLGSIYWHMVSKLQLAIGETVQKAIENNDDKTIVETLKHHYYEVKKGIGAHKSPSEYGSFPFDPYSHTPIMAGVQQPGMTGQVKEDIISRFMELGIIVENGKIYIDLTMLNIDEFHRSDNQHIPWLTVTFCFTPFTFYVDEKSGIDIKYANGKIINLYNYEIPADISQFVFMRTKEIAKIVVHIQKNKLT
ncbi:MAG: hypothetical protein H6537_04855 [Bacteroidales bacterium]|nr:hypothetical protein [Bacteroidales bacterium]